MFCRIVFSFVCSFVLSQMAFAQDIDSTDRPISDKWAFIVGISKFQNPACQPLQYSAKDASDFRDFLINKANFAADHVKLLTNEEATREHIISELGQKWLPYRTINDDLVVIFFSTHGSSSENDQVGGLNYLVAYNTDPNELLATGIPFQDITALIKSRINAKRIVLILDACHSGSASASGAKGLRRVSNFDANEIAQGTGQLVICSSEPSQSSLESKRYPNSVFTHHLIESLSAQGEQTRLVNAFEKSRKDVSIEVAADRGQSQSPVLKMFWQGSGLQLSAPPAEPRSADTGAILVSRSVPVQNGVERRAVDAQKALNAAAQSQAPAIAPVQEPIRLPNRLCVLPFDAPMKLVTDLDGLDIIFGVDGKKIESGSLQVMVAKKLYAKYGTRVVVMRSLEQPLRYKLNLVPASTWTHIGTEVQSKYLLCCSIDEIYFRVKMRNQYRFVCSARIVSAETGATIWEANRINVERRGTPSWGMGYLECFNTIIIPEMAATISTQVESVLAPLSF